MNTPREEAIVHESASVKDTRKRKLLIVIVAIFLLSFLGGSIAGVVAYQAVKSSAEGGAELAQEVRTVCEDTTNTSDDLSSICPKAEEVISEAPAQVDVPEDGVNGTNGTDGVDGSDGQDGRDALPISQSQATTAITRFCRDTGECRGPSGADATSAQVAIAVSSYCNRRGECRGVPGVDGVDADPVTQDQLISAVAAYCGANDGCRGEPGTDGTNGTDGADSTVPGPPGLIQFTDNCEAAPEGQKIVNVDTDYNRDTQTATITCSYAEDQTGLVAPPNQGGTP